MLSHTASTSWIRSSTLRLRISSSWVGLMDKVYAGTGRDAICTHNAPAKLRRANTDSKPPRAFRAPPASAGCYAACSPLERARLRLKVESDQEVCLSVTVAYRERLP